MGQHATASRAVLAEATPRAVGPLAVPVIELAFRAPLMPRGRVPPLLPLRGRAAALPTVGLPAVAGPTDEEHRPAPCRPQRHRTVRHTTARAMAPGCR